MVTQCSYNGLIALGYLKYLRHSALHITAISLNANPSDIKITTLYLSHFFILIYE